MPNRVKDKGAGNNSMPKVLLTNRIARTTRAPRLEPPDAEETFSARNHRKLMKIFETGDYPMTEYINRVSGVSNIPSDLLQHDHPYARYPGWRAENYLATPRRILYSSNYRNEVVSENDEIDVESVSEEPPLPSLLHLPPNDPLSKKKDNGDVYESDDDDDASDNSGDETSHWTDKIPRVGWTSQQLRVFPKAVQLIEDTHLPHQVFKGHPNEEILVYSAVRTLAAGFDRLLSSVCWDKLFTQWLHGLLLEKLPPSQIPNYLEVLTALRKRVQGLVDRMIVPCHTGGRSTLSKEFDPPTINIPPKVDQVAEILNTEPLTKLPLGPVFVIVPHTTDAEKCDRFSAILGHLRQMSQVYVVKICQPDSRNLQQAVEQMMAETRAKLTEVRSDYPGRSIILLGWHIGAAVACLVAQLESVRAVICIGFPIMTLDGARGEPNDPILDMTCPVLFMMGSLANDGRCEMLEEMRIHMKVPTQLVIFGSCNDHIIMNRMAAAKFRVTQAMVDRSLLLEVHSFVGATLTETPLPPPRVVQPTTEQRRASPVKRRYTIAQVLDSPSPPLKQFKPPAMNPAAMAIVRGKMKYDPPGPTVKQRKPRMSAAQKLMLDSAKYAAELPPDYAAKLQQASASVPVEPPRVVKTTTVPIVTQAPPVQARFPIKFGNMQHVFPRVTQSSGMPDISLKGCIQSKALKIPGLVLSSMAAKNYKRVADGKTKMVQISSNPQMHLTHHPRSLQSVSSILISPKSGASKPIQVFTGPTTGTNPMLASHMQSVASLSIMNPAPKITRFLTPTTKPADLGKVTVITTKPPFVSRSKGGNVLIMSDDMKGHEVLHSNRGRETVTVYPMVCPYPGNNATAPNTRPVKNTHSKVGSSDEPHINVPMSLNDELLTPDAILKLPVIFAKDGENIFDLPVGMQKSGNDCSFMIPLESPCDVGRETPSSNVIVVSPDNSSLKAKPVVKAPKKYTRRTHVVKPVKYTKVIVTNSKKIQPRSAISEPSPALCALKDVSLVEDFDIILKKMSGN